VKERSDNWRLKLRRGKWIFLHYRSERGAQSKKGAGGRKGTAWEGGGRECLRDKGGKADNWINLEEGTSLTKRTISLGKEKRMYGKEAVEVRGRTLPLPA